MDAGQWIININDILKALMGIAAFIVAIYGLITKPLKKQAEMDRTQNDKLDNLSNEIKEIKQRIHDNQQEYVHDRLQTLRERYVYELGWASADEKRRIIEWYEVYKEHGYNHLSNTYVEDIRNLPERPPERE